MFTALCGSSAPALKEFPFLSQWLMWYVSSSTSTWAATGIPSGCCCAQTDRSPSFARRGRGWGCYLKIAFPNHGPIIHARTWEEPCRRQHLDIGSCGTWQQGGALELRNFACCNGARLWNLQMQPHGQGVWQGDGRMILHVADLHLDVMEAVWSTQVRGFTRQQFLYICQKVADEVCPFFRGLHFATSENWAFVL